MQTTHESGRGKTPPYVSYPSFKTLMAELHDGGMPSRIDRSVLKRFSGVVGTQLMTAFRFLGFLDDQSQPTSRLTELVQAYGTPEWGHKFIPVLQDAYAPLFGLDLGNASASHFDETFRKSFPGSDAVLAKSTNFFLGAAKDSGIMISDRVFQGRKPRKTNGAPRRRATRRAESSASIPNQPVESLNQNLSAGKKVSEVLLDNFDPNDMDDEQQAAIWTLLRYFKAKGQ